MIIWAILKIDKKGTQTNWPKDKEIERWHRLTEYVKKEKEREPASTEDSVDTIKEFKEYRKKSEERLIKADNNNNSNIMTNRKATKTSKQKWEEKHLYEYF